MKGKFIGKTSMGFVSGKTYNLESKLQMVTKQGRDLICIYLYDKDSSAWCPYSSLENVFKNWEFIKDK